MKKINNNRGFGLVETLISIVLLSIVMAAGMALYFDSDEMMGLAMRKKVAEQISNAKMEDLRIAAFVLAGYNGLSSSTSNVNVGGLSGTQTVTVATKILTNGGGTLDPTFCKEAKVKVDWTEPGKIEAPQQIELWTFIVKP